MMQAILRQPSEAVRGPRSGTVRLVRGAQRDRLDRPGEPVAEARRRRDPIGAVLRRAQKLAQGGDLHGEITFLDGEAWPRRIHEIGL